MELLENSYLKEIEEHNVEKLKRKFKKENVC